jgi:hypothetical protein
VEMRQCYLQLRKICCASIRVVYMSRLFVLYLYLTYFRSQNTRDGLHAAVNCVIVNLFNSNPQLSILNVHIKSVILIWLSQLLFSLFTLSSFSVLSLVLPCS